MLFKGIRKRRNARNIVGVWRNLVEDHMSGGKPLSNTRYANVWQIEVRANGTYTMSGDIPFPRPAGLDEINGTWEMEHDGSFMLHELGMIKKAEILKLDDSTLILQFKGDELSHLMQNRGLIEDNVDTVVLTFHKNF